jgi:hypothetical protein
MTPDTAHHSQPPLQIHRHFDLFWKYVTWSLFPLRGIVYSIHLYIFMQQNMSTFEYRLARHWGAGVIHAGSRQGYLKKNSWIELCMVDKGFGGRQYQKTTLASNPKRD